MFKITVEGKNLAEFKKNVQEFNDELNGVNVINVSADKLTVENIKPSEIEELPANDSFETPDPTPTVVAPIKEEVIVPAVAPAAVVNTSTELDAAGLPWDGRIHSSGKTKSVSKGTWNKKRKTPAELVAQIEAELRNGVVAAGVQPPVVAPIAQPAVVTPVVAQPAPVAIPPQPAMVEGAHTLETFTKNFPLVLGRLITEGRVTQEYVEQLNAYFGVAQIVLTNDAQKAEMFETFVAAELITRAM